MTECEINQYVRSHDKYISCALRPLRGRLSSEDIEDARQEVLITMLSCLRRYNPEIGPVDTYVTNSIRNRALSFMKKHLSESKRALYHDSLSMESPAFYNSDMALSETLPSEYRSQEEQINADLLSVGLLECLDARTKDIVKMWMEGEMFYKMGEKYGITAERCWKIVQNAFITMREAYDNKQQELF